MHAESKFNSRKVQNCQAHVEPLKIIKVDAFGVALNPLHGRTAGFHRTQLRLHVITEDGLDVQELVRLVGLVGLV